MQQDHVAFARNGIARRLERSDKDEGRGRARAELAATSAEIFFVSAMIYSGLERSDRNK